MPSSVITVNFDGPFTGCANLNRLELQGGRQARRTTPWRSAARAGPWRSSRTPCPTCRRIEVRAQSHRELPPGHGPPGSKERTPTVHPPRGCRPNSTQLQGTDGSDVASFTDQPVSGLKPRLVSAEVDGATLTLTFDETLNPDSRVYHWMFNVTVNGARRGVVTGGSHPWSEAASPLPARR